MENLTIPLKYWKDQAGNKLYRLGDLPNGIDFKYNEHEYQTHLLPRTSHAGKRQCLNKSTGSIDFLYCSKKVIVSKPFEK